MPVYQSKSIFSLSNFDQVITTSNLKFKIYENISLFGFGEPGTLGRSYNMEVGVSCYTKTLGGHLVHSIDL